MSSASVDADSSRSRSHSSTEVNPVELEQLPDPRADLLLLLVKPALTPFDSAGQVLDRDPKRRDDRFAPLLGGMACACIAHDLRELADEFLGEQAEALAGEDVACVFDVELDDAGRERCEVELAGPHEPLGVDPCEEFLVAQALDRMGSPGSDVLRIGLDELADLREEVDHRVVLDPALGRVVLSRVESGEEAQIDRLEVELRAAVVKRGHSACRIGER